MRIDETITFEEWRLMELLKNKSRMEKDQILGENEWLTKNSRAE